MKFNTKTIHGGLEPDSATGAVMTPIYQTSTYAQEGVGVNKGFEYSRTANPTREALEKNIAVLENGKFGFAFGSGMAATDCLFRILSPGDEVIAGNDLYGGSYRLFTTVYERYGIKFHFIDLQNLEELKGAITNHTKMVWMESPTNPMMNIYDIEEVARITKQHGLLLGVDNTFATPFNQLPLDLGADVVMHSATKYLGGHSDVVMGLLVVKDSELAGQLYKIQNTTGGITAPMDSFLVLRGIKTLHLRMQCHAQNGKLLAEYLSTHPKVDKVYWPGLESHKGHAVAKKQMKTFGGMLSFSLKEDTKEAATMVLNKVKLFTLAESLGGVESLIGHPSTMTHAAIPVEERRKVGITDSLIRLSVGIEDGEDLLMDLKQALG